MRKKGPAAKAGLKLKDIILEINGKKIPNTKALRMLFQDDAEIDELGVKILRGEEKKDIKVKLAKDENHDK